MGLGKCKSRQLHGSVLTDTIAGPRVLTAQSPQMNSKYRLPGLGLVLRHRVIKVVLQIWGTHPFLATLQFYSLVVHFIGCFWQKNILAIESHRVSWSADTNVRSLLRDALPARQSRIEEGSVVPGFGTRPEHSWADSPGLSSLGSGGLWSQPAWSSLGFNTWGRP